MNHDSAKHESAKCEAAQQDIALAVYGELADDAAHRLDQHLSDCEHCRQELRAVEGLHEAMALYPMEDPSPNLLARSRLRLEEALDTVPRSGWLTRMSSRFFNSLAHMHAAPVMASGLLVMGLTAGGVSGYKAGVKAATPKPESRQTVTQYGEGAPQIANISNITEEPNSANVEISYNRLVPETAKGSLDDAEIRHLLLLAAQSRVNTGVRDDSLGLLADECRAGHQCADGPIRDALMVALRYDKKPEVRLKALEGLQPYIGEDVRVRDSVLDALMKDSDPKVRTKAISVLEPVQADSSVRQVLHNVSHTDENPYIRNVSRQVLDGLPEVQ